MAHEQMIDEIDLEEMYVNIATSCEPARAQLPFIVADDIPALRLACSTTGISTPGDLRAARIRSTLDPDTLVVSEPVARDLEDMDAVTIGAPEALKFENGDFPDSM
jgi:hypothetical protein